MAMIKYGTHCTDTAIVCCRCGSNYIHHDQVEIWERPEDSAIGLHVAVYGSDVEDRDAAVLPSMTVDSSMADNKTTRRQAIAIGLWCESCGCRSRIQISQYKGETHVTHEVES